MAQFSVKIMRLTGSLLGENQQPVLFEVWPRYHRPCTAVFYAG
jgi:hypothetical protein